MVVSRCLIIVLGLYLTLYFLISSGPFKQKLQQLIADAIPGSISVATLKVGPAPWHLRIAEGRIIGLHDEEVIRVKAIDATLDLSRTLGALFYQDGADERPQIFFERVDLLEPWARVEVTADGVGLERALVRHNAPASLATHKPPTPVPIQLQAAEVRVFDAGALIEAPGFRLEANGTNAVNSYALGGKNFMEFPISRATVNHVHMKFLGFSHLPAPIDLDVTDLLVEDFAWLRVGFTWRNAVGRLEGGRFEGSGTLDVAHHHPAWSGEATVHFERGARAIGTLFRGAAEGDFEFSVRGRGDLQQVETGWRLTSPAARFGPLELEALSASGRFLPRGTQAEPRLHAVTLDEGHANLAGGQLAVSDLSWEPRGEGDDSSRDLQALVTLDELDIGPILTTVLDVPLLPEGRWSGSFAMTRGQRPLDGSSRFDLSVIQSPTELTDRPTSEQSGLEVVWAAPVVEGLPREWSAGGRVSFERKVFRTLGPDSDVPLMEGLTIEGLRLDAGPHRARLAGRIDLASGVLDLEPYLRLGDISKLTGPFADAAGRLVFKDAVIRGSLEAPTISGLVNWTGAELDGRALGQVTGRIDLTEGTLGLEGMRSNSRLGSFNLNGHISLFEPRTGIPPRLSDTMPFSLDVRALEGLDLSALSPELGPNARLDITRGTLSGALRSPRGGLVSLRGQADVELHHIELGEERELGLTTHLEVRPGLDVTLARLRITQPSGLELTGQLAVGPARGQDASRPLSGNLELAPLALSRIKSLGTAVPGLEATVGGRLTLGGSTTEPSFIGTLKVDAARFDEIRLGSASLQLSTRGDGKRREVELAAFDDAFFPGYSLVRGVLTLDSLRPMRFETIISGRNKRLTDFVPSARDAPIDIVGSASAEVEVDLRASTLSARLRAKPEAMELIVKDRGLRWTNAGELVIVSAADRLRLLPTSLRPRGSQGGAQSTLGACGYLEAGRLAFQLTGTADLGLVPGLDDIFSVSQGRFEILEDPEARDGVGPDKCLDGPVLAISGSLTSPVATGRLGPRDIILVPRGSGREVRIRDESTLLLRSRGLEQSLVVGGLSDGAPLRGELDEGTFALSGRIDFVSLLPDALDLQLSGTDLAFQKPGEFTLTANPDVRLVASGLRSPEPSVRLGGDIALSDGRFTKSFDTFARAIGGALGTREETYSTSLLDSLPALRQARLDLNVSASDFEIQAALPLARTDLPVRLDLTLQGTPDEPRLYRRVDLLPGGTLQYFVFERTFTVTAGAIDFDGDPAHPLVEVTAQTPITYVQRAQTALQEEDEKEVTITLRMSGRLPDLKIELLSDDATLDQADIQSLLLTGKPRNDIDRAQESRLVSADLSNVINTILAAPFVRRASVGLDQKGGLEYRVGTCFAPNLCFDTTTISDDTETTLRARFSLSIGDDVVCEGTLRRSDGVTTTEETYEARCRYRIPLE